MTSTTRNMPEFPRCAACAPDEWPQPIVDHRCAESDEDRLWGTIVYTMPRHDGDLHDRYTVMTWPTCPACGEEYCTRCGVHAWYQCL